ncbi:hypothetical protein EPN83_00845 [Patescibacteria group bacterium]|nr:MAG: hypothetical protein EPN83_00845 [Patescibacteria group bacterium]
MEAFIRIIGVILILIFSHYTSLIFGKLFCLNFECGGGWIGPDASEYFSGIAPAFIFFSTLFLSYLAKKTDYVILGILLILPLIYLISFDPYFIKHLWFYVLVLIVALTLGIVLRQIIAKTKST